MSLNSSLNIGRVRTELGKIVEFTLVKKALMARRLKGGIGVL